MDLKEVISIIDESEAPMYVLNLPIRKMPKHHISHEYPEHEDSLRQILQPLSIAYEVPIRHNGLMEDAVVIFVMRAVGLANAVEHL